MNTTRPPHVPAIGSPRGARHWRATVGALLVPGLLVLGLAGCGTGTADDPTADADPTDVISEGGGDYTPAETTLVLDGQEIETGEAQCGRTVSEETGEPTIQLALHDMDDTTGADVVVTDEETPEVVSAVVLRPDDVPLVGSGQVDGSDLAATRDGNTFTVTGTVAEDGTEGAHQVEMTTVCSEL